MPQTHRTEERVSMKVPVSLPGGLTGMTRDISASGIYFETDNEPLGNSPLAFAVEFKNDSGVGMILRCRGQVLRVEHQGNRVGVAARILESKLEPGRGKIEETRKLVISDGFADSF